MQLLAKKNCAVCRETAIDKIIRLIKPIDSFLPSNATKTVIGSTAQVFSLKLLKPNPNSLQVEWRLDGQLIDSNKDQISVLRSQLTNKTGTLSVSVFDSTGLTKTESTRAARTYVQSWPLEKADLPNIPTVSASKAICAGESTTLTASNCSGSLAWSSGQTTPSIDVTPTQTTTYGVNCTVNGLKSEDSKITITVTLLPAATATNNGPYTEGATIELTGTGGGTYAWKGPASYTSTVASPKITDAKQANAGAYTLVVTKDNCQATATTTVVLNPPKPTLVASKTAVCADESVTLTASNCASTLAWSSGQTTPSIDVTPTQTTTYSVNCTVNGLKSEDAKVTITVTPLPAATATNNGPYLEGKTIELTGTGGGTYTWTGPASFASTEASPKIVESKVVNSGTYSLVVSKDGCKITVTTSVTVSPILSINPNLAGREATIYPNPAEDLIKIDLSAVKTTTAAIIELYDFEGRSLLKQESTKTVSELNIRSLTSGIYLLKINAGKYQSVHKVIKR